MSEIPEKAKGAVLCLVDPDDGRAYFTTCGLGYQWGNDWNDAPYEANCGHPYIWGSRIHDVEKPWQIWSCEWEGPYAAPCDSMKCVGLSLSVQTINTGCVAWLWPEGSYSPIFAGITLPDFQKVLESAGGTISDVKEFEGE